MQDKQNSMAFNREAPSFQMLLYDLLRKNEILRCAEVEAGFMQCFFYLIYDKGGKKTAEKLRAEISPKATLEDLVMFHEFPFKCL